jgi:hypothetical protein
MRYLLPPRAGPSSMCIRVEGGRRGKGNQVGPHGSTCTTSQPGQSLGATQEAGKMCVGWVGLVAGRTFPAQRSFGMSIGTRNLRSAQRSCFPERGWVSGPALCLPASMALSPPFLQSSELASVSLPGDLSYSRPPGGHCTTFPGQGA